MPLMTWNESLSVGVQEFDEHHQKLINMLNHLHDAMSKGQGREALEPLLTALIQYTAKHFGAEEKRMRESQYPAYLQHKVQHDQLTRKVVDLKKRLDSGQTAITVELLNFLKDWLTTHIQGTDKKYAPFFAQQGAAAVR